jgi:hypothetical protein
MKDIGYAVNDLYDQYDFNGMWMREDYTMDEYRHRPVQRNIC